MKTKLVGSANTLEQMTALLVKYFGGTKIEIVNVRNGLWNIANSSGHIEGCFIVLKKDRYRFEIIVD